MLFLNRWHTGVLLLTVCFAYSVGERGSSAEERHKIIFKGNYGMAFVNPKAANNELNTENSDVTSVGVKGFNLPQVRSLSGLDVFAGYEASDRLDIGISYSVLSKEIDASGATSTNVNVVESDSFGMSNFHFRSYYYFAIGEGFRFYFSPSVGLTSYSIDGKLTVSSGSSVEVANYAASNTSLSFRGSFGATFDINPTISLVFDGGYAYAKSGGLKVDSQSGTTYITGQTVKWRGIDAVLDFSGPYITVGLSIRFPPPRITKTSEGQPQTTSIEKFSDKNPATIDSIPLTREPSSNIESRLNQLQRMRKNGLISEKDYEQKKKTLLEEF